LRNRGLRAKKSRHLKPFLSIAVDLFGSSKSCFGQGGSSMRLKLKPTPRRLVLATSAALAAGASR
jgi:hypothetical protein